MAVCILYTIYVHGDDTLVEYEYVFTILLYRYIYPDGLPSRRTTTYVYLYIGTAYDILYDDDFPGTSVNTHTHDGYLLCARTLQTRQ